MVLQTKAGCARCFGKVKLVNKECSSTLHKQPHADHAPVEGLAQIVPQAAITRSPPPQASESPLVRQEVLLASDAGQQAGKIKGPGVVVQV